MPINLVSFGGSEHSRVSVAGSDCNVSSPAIWALRLITPHDLNVSVEREKHVELIAGLNMRIPG